MKKSLKGKGIGKGKRKVRKKIVAMILLVVMLLTMLAVFKPTSMAATEAEIDQVLNLGMQWLVAQQNVDGSWGTVDQVGKTGFAVLKFETHAVTNGEDPLDPTYEYYDQVRNGLDYIFANASIIPISVQPSGDPDTDGDSFGVYFGSDFVQTYETGIAMMAIAVCTHPEMVVNVLGSSVDGWTYEEVLQDAVDYLAFGQTDTGNGRGGWGYAENEGGSDNSNTGYATLGLAYAEASAPYGFALTIPVFVKSELNIWIDYIQNDPGPLDDGGETDPDGGSGYTDPNFNVNILKTGHLLCEMAFVGDTRATQRVTDAVDYVVRHWNDANVDPGWVGSPAENASYQAMYTTMTGLEALGIDEIDGIDWLDEFSDVLVAQQNPDGSLPPCLWDDGEQILATEWALLTLQKVVVPPPTIPKYIPFRRCTFVYSDPTSYLDEYAFLASVPANVFRDEAGNFYRAPIIYGESMAGNYLLEDWKTYCDHWGGVSYIDFVGPYSNDYMSYMKGYLGTNNYTSIMVNDPYKYGKEIALREWINSSSAVITPSKTYFTTPAVTYGDFQGEFFNVTEEEYYISHRFGFGGPPSGEYATIEPPIESPHPYLNDMYVTYDVWHPGAANISVHFPKIDLELGFDYLYIYDRDWNLITSYDGYYEDVWTPIVPGDLVNIVLATDYSVTYWGFIADAYVWNATPPPEFVIHRGEWLNFTIPANIPGIMITEVQLLNWIEAVGETWLACFLIDPDGNVVDYDFTPETGYYTWMMWDVNERPRTTTENYTVAIYCIGFEGGVEYGLVIEGVVYGFSRKPGNLDVHTIIVPENARELDAWLSCNSTAKGMSWVSMWLIDPEGNILFPNYLESEYTEYPPSPLYVSDIGHLNTLHPTPGNWTLIAEAALLGSYRPEQTVEYIVQYRIASYNEMKLDYVEAAANGAVIASLLNAPLLFTATDALPEETRETLQILGVEEVIFVDPAGIISGPVKSQITGMGITIAQDLLSLGDIVSYIPGLSGQTDIILTVPTDNFFAPAALAGAFHGAPVLSFKGKAKEIPTLADSTWASQYFHEFYGYYLDWLLKAPPIHWMHELAAIWSEWIGGLGADAIGMESVVTVAPLMGVKPVFERAIAGVAKAGRIPGENAEEDVAFVNRAMLYPAIIYANPGYSISMPTCVSYDYGMPDINSDVPPNLIQPPDYRAPQSYVYRVNGWGNTTNAMESRGFTLEPHVGKYEVFDKLTSGVAFWYHSDHGGLGFVWDYLPFGQGGVGLWYEDPPDPQPKRGYEYNMTTYAEDASIPDQYNLYGYPYPDGAVFQGLGEPFSFAYGGEFDRWLGNIHSVHISFMDCYVGGSLLPLTMMRHGAASAIGDMRTGLLLDTDWFCVKYTQEVMAGRALGEAFVTAVKKTGYVYPNTYFEMTLFSRVWVFNYMIEPGWEIPWYAYPYVDDCCNAYVLYGDPDMILVDPTAAEPEALDPTEIIIVGHDPEQVVHNVGIAGVKPSKTVVGQGYSVSISVNVENQGRQTETLDITVYYNSNVIRIETIALTSGAFKTITFTWNTTGVPYGNYTISARATIVPGETDTTDNTLIDGMVFVTITGDVNGDGTVDVSDLFDLSKAYGYDPSKPNWNPNCDFNGDDKVDASDLFDLSKKYGKTI